MRAAIARAAPAAPQRPLPEGDEWRLQPIDPADVGVSDPADLAWLRARATPHPFACFTQPLSLAQPIPDTLPCTYIHCTANQSLAMAAFAQAARTTPGWRLRLLATGHEAPVTAPHALAALILEAATIGRAVV